MYREKGITCRNLLKQLAFWVRMHPFISATLKGTRFQNRRMHETGARQIRPPCGICNTPFLAFARVQRGFEASSETHHSQSDGLSCLTWCHRAFGVAVLDFGFQVAPLVGQPILSFQTKSDSMHHVPSTKSVTVSGGSAPSSGGSFFKLRNPRLGHQP